MTTSTVSRPSSTHWGIYEAQVRDGRLVGLHPHAADADPSPLGDSLAATVTAPTRIAAPAVRAGYLEHGWRSDSAGRGREPFVEVDWPRALDLAAGALARVRERFGNEAIFAGSYGWASAGRFHHAQSQLHRFMNLFGGYTRHVDTYSTAAGSVVLRRVLGEGRQWPRYAPDWASIAEHAELVVCFGGIALKNGQVNAGGVGRHVAAGGLRACREAGVEFVNVGPLAGDLPAWLDAQWLAARPNTDTALMLGLAHTLLVEGRLDRAFLAGCCEGFEQFLPYLTGDSDGQPKDAAWASAICGIEPGVLRELALRMAGARTLITVSWSVQRAEFGEQPYWMAVTLAAMLGQVGLPGRGVAFGLGAVNGIGLAPPGFEWGRLEQGTNPVGRFIPVARIADLLLDPGGVIDYDGQRLTFPDIRLLYWAGGNPFHHHQDLNRLLGAWRKPETVIVNDIHWTAVARHADIVFPITTTLERNDIGCSALDRFIVPMHKALEAVGGARNDHDVFAGLAERLGFVERFTEGRDERRWLQHLYESSRAGAAQQGVELPEFTTFWAGGARELPPPGPIDDPLAALREDPRAYPLTTPSGRIEIYSATVAGFGYADCAGHARWYEPSEWLGAAAARQFGLHLISNQPRTRLHGQLDNGPVSLASKVRGREPIVLHPDDARRRGIREGDVVRVFNRRGACLAGAVLSEEVRRGVVLLAPGAWYDPLQPGEAGTLECHGNVNVLTLDRGSSRLAQAPSAQSALVEVERFEGEPPPVRAFEPPTVVRPGGD